MSIDYFSTKKLTDVGTRYQHLRELLDAWEQGLELMGKYAPADENDRVKLTHGIDLMHKQLNVMSDYGDNRFALARMIDDIPTDPTKIKGGRGTPLK